jgi:hypothetical protein
VQGENGAWVGVEVPMPFGHSWTSSSGVGDAASSVVTTAATAGGDRNGNERLKRA